MKFPQSGKGWELNLTKFFCPCSYCCGTSEASEQQHNQDLREKYIGYEKSRFDRFLPEFTAPRTHLEPEFTAPRTIASLSFKPRFHFILRK